MLINVMWINFSILIQYMFFNIHTAANGTCVLFCFTGTAPSTKRRSRIGSPSCQHHLMSLNSGLLCKTFGFIWKLSLLVVILPKTCHRYSPCFISLY